MTGTYLKNDSKKGICGFAFKDIFAPSIVVIGFFIGLFHTTNYWDYPPKEAKRLLDDLNIKFPIE